MQHWSFSVGDKSSGFSAFTSAEMCLAPCFPGHGKSAFVAV